MSQLDANLWLSYIPHKNEEYEWIKYIKNIIILINCLYLQIIT
jgi:hypothetical protein